MKLAPPKKKFTIFNIFLADVSYISKLCVKFYQNTEKIRFFLPSPLKLQDAVFMLLINV